MMIPSVLPATVARVAACAARPRPRKSPAQPEAMPKAAIIVYRNYREEVGSHRIKPLRLFFGTSAYYREPQWLLEAYSLDKQQMRTYSLGRILKWGE